jgi:hypothetical protein
MEINTAVVRTGEAVIEEIFKKAEKSRRKCSVYREGLK